MSGGINVETPSYFLRYSMKRNIFMTVPVITEERELYNLILR